MPRLSVVGPRTFNVFIEEHTVSAVYRVDGVQTRGDLNVTWTGPGVQSPTSRTTRITLDTGSAVDGVVAHSITVTGSDADGALPPTTLEIRINVSTNPLPPGSDLDPNRVYAP